MTTPEIEELKQLVKQKYGKTLATTTDFEEFSLYLKKKEDKNVSSSTLKRLYGYVSDEHKPRLTTLDPLAQYIGHADYKDFVCWLKNSTLYNSSFFMADQLTSSQLTAGTELVIGWSPNRMLTLRYLGESLYEVVTTENSKLLCGDCFVATALWRAASSRGNRFCCPMSNATERAPCRLWQDATAGSRW